jgi:hypothetical protein
MRYLPPSAVRFPDKVADLCKTKCLILALQEVSGMIRKLRNGESQINELGSDPEEARSDSAGQSGDAQGLSQSADSDEESVGELAETDQAYEAGTVEGLEDAANRPERSVRTRENKGRS